MFHYQELPALDLAHFGDMVGHDDALGRDMLDFFLKNAATYLSELAEIAETAENWKAEVHKFKGAARAIGAKQIAAIGQVAEPLTLADVEARKDFLEIAQTLVSDLKEYHIKF